MKKLVLVLIVLLASTVVYPMVLYAKTGYVTDQLLLTLREGPNKSFSVIKVLKSNEAVTILEEQEEYLRVETGDNETGWVEKQYITYDTPGPLIIASLNDKVSRLEEQIKTLESGMDESQQKYASQSSELNQKAQTLEAQLKDALKNKDAAQDSLQAIQKKHDALVEQSKNVIEIQKANQALTRENTELQTALSQMEAKLSNQFKTAMIKWFLAGVGVLLLGWIMGKSLTGGRKKSSSLLD